jgi:hypothetical protein
VLSAISNFLTADLKGQHVCIELGFRLRKIASERHKMLKTASNDKPVRGTQTLSGIQLGRGQL